MIFTENDVNFTAKEVGEIYKQAMDGRITNLQDLRTVINGIFDLKTDFEFLFNLIPKPKTEVLPIKDNEFTVSNIPLFFDSWTVNDIVYIEDEEGYFTPFKGVEFKGVKGKIKDVPDYLANGKIHLTYFTLDKLNVNGGK